MDLIHSVLSEQTIRGRRKMPTIAFPFPALGVTGMHEVLSAHCSDLGHGLPRSSYTRSLKDLEASEPKSPLDAH